MPVDEEDIPINAELQKNSKQRRRSTRKRKSIVDKDKPTKKKKSKTVKKAPSAELSVEMNEREGEDVVNSNEAGKEEYLKLAREMCRSQNEDLGVSNSKAKTGVNYISQMKYDFILENLLVLDRYKHADAKARLEIKEEYELCKSKMKPAWKYQFRLKWYDDVAKVQKPSWSYSKKRTNQNPLPNVSSQ